MSALSDYLENKWLDHLLKATAYSKPTTLYFALFTADPGESSNTGELSGNGYTRAAVTNNNASFPQCSITGTPTKANAVVVQFPTASAAWGIVTHWAAYDASSGGNMIIHGALASQRRVASGDAPRIGIGEISMTITNASTGGLSDFAKRRMLDHTFGGPSYSTPSPYFGLGTALAGETLTELTDASYSRSSIGFESAAAGIIANSSDESLSAGMVAAATVTHFGIWDDATDGNLLVFGPVTTPRTVAIGDSLSTPTGGVSVTAQ